MIRLGVKFAPLAAGRWRAAPPWYRGRADMRAATGKCVAARLLHPLRPVCHTLGVRFRYQIPSSADDVCLTLWYLCLGNALDDATKSALATVRFLVGPPVHLQIDRAVSVASIHVPLLEPRCPGSQGGRAGKYEIRRTRYETAASQAGRPGHVRLIAHDEVDAFGDQPIRAEPDHHRCHLGVAQAIDYAAQSHRSELLVVVKVVAGQDQPANYLTRAADNEPDQSGVGLRIAHVQNRSRALY